jgi:molybdenum cofactor biosynthesis enzyme
VRGTSKDDIVSKMEQQAGMMNVSRKRICARGLSAICPYRLSKNNIGILATQTFHLLHFARPTFTSSLDTYM